MTTSEVDEAPNSRTARVRAIHALAKGMTPSLLVAETSLLALVEEALPSSGALRDTQQAKILYSAFEKVATCARETVLSIKDIKNVTPAEREATWIAAAGELLDLTDEASFIHKLGPGRALYDDEVAGRTAWHVRKVRASKWTIITSVRSVERNAEEFWWPVFLVAVEHHLASAPVTAASQLADRVAASDPTYSAHFARQIQLSGLVRRALDAAYTSCDARNRAFYTSDLLLALLDMPRSRTADCFEETRVGLVRDMRKWLSEMNPAQVHPFQPFEWVERLDVQVAQDLAILDASPVVTEIYLLLGVLGSESGTRGRLVEHLGPDGYNRLYEAANRRRRHPTQILRTPGPG